MSKKNTSVLVSAMGVLTGFGTAFAAAFKKRGGRDEDLHQLLVGSKSENFIAKIVDLAMEMVKVVRDGFRVVVDYAKSLTQMIADGNYGWVNNDITESHFPTSGQGKVELNTELVHYDKRMELDDIVRDMQSRGLRPATLPELLAFGAKYPEKQREFPIVALGSVWRLFSGSRPVAYLLSLDSERELRLFVWPGDWGVDYRFLAVRK